MPQFDPMDRFISNYRSTQKLFDKQEDSMNPLSVDDRVEYLKATQELQMANIGVDLALRSRHGLLKKALDKIA